VTDDELREQLALYAVGALPDDERREVEETLSTRPDLQAELAELQAAAGTLAAAVAESPSAALRGRVLDIIADTPQLPPAAPADGPVAPVVPIGRRRRNRFIVLGAAAAAVIAILVGVLVASPWSGNEASPTAAVLDAEDAQTIEMPGTGVPGSLPDVTIVHSPSENASVLQAPDIPVPQGDRVYELWAIRDGTPERYTTFRPDASGGLSVYAAGLDPASAEQWAITEEPAGGSDAPTPPILNATA
jgi:anti-sigma-K factor RskA